MVAEPERRVGSLTIVGAGIRPGLHTTREASARIRRRRQGPVPPRRDGADPLARAAEPSAESLEHAYRPGRPYVEVYEEVVDTIVDHVRRGLDVCVVFYGHPGVLRPHSYEAMAQVRAEGFPATILPGITAEDVLYVDLEPRPWSDRVPELRRDGLPRSTAGDRT